MLFCLQCKRKVLCIGSAVTRPALCRFRMILRLPNDLLQAVADFAQSEALSRCCRSLRRALGACRYVKLNVDRDHSAARVALVAGNVRSLQLRLVVWRMGGGIMRSLGALRHAPVLHTLTVVFVGTCLGDEGAQAIASLRHVPALHRLSLHLWGISIGDDGAQAFAALKDAPLLHTLRLYLGMNSIGDRGAQAFAALKDAPALHTLSVCCCANTIGVAGARALAALKDAPGLQSLTLDLAMNCISDDGAQVSP